MVEGWPGLLSLFIQISPGALYIIASNHKNLLQKPQDDSAFEVRWINPIHSVACINWILGQLNLIYVIYCSILLFVKFLIQNHKGILDDFLTNYVRFGKTCESSLVSLCTLNFSVKFFVQNSKPIYIILGSLSTYLFAVWTSLSLTIVFACSLANFPCSFLQV